jgi:hypothetical protein
MVPGGGAACSDAPERTKLPLNPNASKIPQKSKLKELHTLAPATLKMASSTSSILPAGGRPSASRPLPYNWTRDHPCRAWMRSFPVTCVSCNARIAGNSCVVCNPASSASPATPVSSATPASSASPASPALHATHASSASPASPALHATPSSSASPASPALGEAGLHVCPHIYDTLFLDILIWM